MHFSVSIKLAAVSICICVAVACSRRPTTDEPGADIAGEPEQFTATIVSSIDEGVERELSVTRVFKSGDLKRAEWTEQGEPRALIWRPDLGKSYLLDIGQRCYIETDITPGDVPESHKESDSLQNRTVEDSAVQRSAHVSREAISGDVVDRAFGDAPAPVSVDTRRLADKMIDGHRCAITERRAIFADDSVDVTTTFRARDLNGLAIRVETSSTNTGAKLITSWRDIRTDAPAEVFIVPSDFRRVEKLSR
jgi:hypothetical protein